MTLAVVLALSLVPVSAVESLQEEEGAQWITVEGIEGGQIFFNSETGEIEDVSRKYGAEITKANIPSSINGVGVTSIGNGAFRGCTKLEEVTIPSGVIRIGSYAFEGCSTLPKIDLPESVTKIGEGCFSSCNSLEKVIIRAKDTELPDESINGQGVFRDCPRLTSAGPIGSECDIEFAWEEAIPIGLFAEFKSLKKMILPSTIREVYWDWQWCNNFSTAGPIGGNSDDIEFGWDTEIPDEAFSNLNGLTSVTLPDTITHIGEFAFGSCGKLSEINIPEMVSSIENGAFAGTGLQEIKIPDGVTCIESTLFSDCKELVEVLLPDKLTIIEEKAFSACPKLCKIDIPESVVSIGDYAFSGTGLREISIPNEFLLLVSICFMDVRTYLQ